MAVRVTLLICLFTCGIFNCCIKNPWHLRWRKLEELVRRYAPCYHLGMIIRPTPKEGLEAIRAVPGARKILLLMLRRSCHRYCAFMRRLRTVDWLGPVSEEQRRVSRESAHAAIRLVYLAHILIRLNWREGVAKVLQQAAKVADNVRDKQTFEEMESKAAGRIRVPFGWPP